MAAALLSPGRALLTSAGRAGLLFAVAPQVIVVPPANPVLSTVPNLYGWWDAGVAPSSGWGTAVNFLNDLSGYGNYALVPGGATANARLAGFLGGLGTVHGPTNYTVLEPYVDPGNRVTATVPVNTDGSLTVYLVWTRPNPTQDGTNPTNQPSQLLAIGSTTVLDMTGRGDGTDTLRLFPAGAAIPAGTLTLRHTHSIRVCFSPAGVDVWLDTTRVISGAANTLALSGTAALSMLNGAQCFFHEAGAWPRALSTSDHAQLSLCAARWPAGNRPQCLGIAVGQSNEGNFYNAAFPMLQALVGYWSGRVAYAYIQDARGVGSSVYSGRGIYGSAGDTGNLLTNSGNGDPTTWAYGYCGSQFQTMVAALTPDQLSGLAYISWFWSETDSTRPYAEKALFAGALRRAWMLMRQTVGLTAAQLPILVISALPFPGSDGGCQMMREVMADAIADPSLNAHMMLAHSSDAIGAGDTWDAATGLESGGGNGAHRDNTGLVTFARRMALPIAQAVIKSAAARGTADVITSVPAALSGAGGPIITSAHYEGGGHILVTLAHTNGATDLAVPLRAALGVGWAVMDGGTPAAPGPILSAVSCAYVSPTTVRVTLVSAPANPTTATLFYPYGQTLDAAQYSTIGQGNAVTDNWSSVVLPAGWQVATDYGGAAQPDMPIQTPAYGIPLT